MNEAAITVAVEETKIETKIETSTSPNPCTLCGAASDYGVVGINEDDIYHLHFCHSCYHNVKRKGNG